MKYKLLVFLILVMSIAFCYSQTTTLSSIDQISAGNATQGTLKQVIFHFHLARNAGGTVNLTGINFTTGGTYQSTDITKFQLWTNTSDAIGSATQISSDIQSGLVAGSHTFDPFSQLLTPSATRYFWITTEIAYSAITSRTINVPAWTTSNYTIDNGTALGSAGAGGTQTITAFASLNSDYFHSFTTGDWGNAGTWESSHDNINWAIATLTPSNLSNIITVRNGHIVTVATGVSIDQATIDPGGQININSGVALTISNGADTYDLTVNGTLRNNAGTITITSSAAIYFGNGSLYQSNFTTSVGLIPSATWHPNSTCEIVGYTTFSGTQTGLGQSFGNFKWNCPAQTTSISAIGALTSIAGDFIITATNTGQFSLTTTTFTTLAIGGNLNISAGTFNMSSGSGISIINLVGNFTMSGGTLTTALTGSGTINFAGTIPQVISITNSPSIRNYINWAVNNGATLEFENSSTVLSGTSGTFTAGSGSTLIIKHPAGIAPTNTYLGCIQNSGTRTYSVGANYTYAGIATQVSGTGYPTGGTGTLKVNTSSGVSFSLSASRTLGSNGKIDLTSGTFAAGTLLTLGPGSSITRSDGSMTGTIQGSNAYSVVYHGDSKITGSELSGNGLGNITIDLNSNNTLTLDRTITVDNLEILSFTQGSLSLSNFNLIMNGIYSGTNLFIYNGTGALGGGNLGNDVNVILTTTSPSSLPSTINTLTVAPGNGNTTLLPGDVTATSLTFVNGSLGFNGHAITLFGQDFALSGPNSISSLSVTLSNVSHTYMTTTSIPHTWQTNGTLNGSVNITFSYPSNISSANLMSVIRRDHVIGESTWNFVENIITVDHGSFYTVTLNNVTSLNGSTKGDLDWTLVETEQDLPVELSSFTVTLGQQDYVTLQWVTQSETDESGFNIFRNNRSELISAVQVNANLIPATNTSDIHTYFFRDMIVTNDDAYYYWLQDISNGGLITYHGPVMVDLGNHGQITPPPEIPIETSIQSIYPNPFNTSTMINYGLAVKGYAYVTVYNVKGQVVRNLISEEKDMQNYHIAWDGKDTQGRTCSTGVYLINLTSGEIKSTMRVLLLK